MITLTRNSVEKPVNIIYAGEIYASDKDEFVETLLGSCIAVCLHDSVKGLSGMNHFMFPSASISVNKISEAGRYGIDAIQELIERLVKKGADRKNLTAKIFGGGHVLKGECNSIQVPENNIRLAGAMLEIEDIPVVERNVGNIYSRKIQMNVKTGEVKCVCSQRHD